MLINNTEARYYIRFKHIPIELMFTPSYLISIDHIEVNCKMNANQWDLQVAICKELEILKYIPDNIIIDTYQLINQK